MPQNLSKIVKNSDLNSIFYFFNSSVYFDWDILLDDLFEQHLIKITGSISNICKPPHLEWSLFKINEHNIFCPSNKSFQKGIPDNNYISYWLESTYIIMSPELLLWSWKLAVKHDVLHLINKDLWDGFFFNRSYFTDNGNWTPSLINPYPDKMITIIEDEIHFFMALKKNIYKENELLKLGNDKILPTQLDFLLDPEVALILDIINILDKDIWCLVFSFLDSENKLSQIWKLQILFFNPTRDTLIKQFLKTNKLNGYFQVPD